jgi:hypothetical protein
MMDLYWEWRALSRTDNDIPAPSFKQRVDVRDVSGWYVLGRI